MAEPLSKRELEVLERMAKGSTNKEIALDLHLSLYTVKSHARNIFGKLGVKNRTEASARARLLGIIKQDAKIRRIAAKGIVSLGSFGDIKSVGNKRSNFQPASRQHLQHCFEIALFCPTHKADGVILPVLFI